MEEQNAPETKQVEPTKYSLSCIITLDALKFSEKLGLSLDELAQKLGKGTFSLSGGDAVRFVLGKEPNAPLEKDIEIKTFSVNAKFGISEQAAFIVKKAGFDLNDFLEWGLGRLFVINEGNIIQLLEVEEK